MSLIPRGFFFDDDFNNFFLPTTVNMKRNDMKCDIYEKDDNYHIDIDIPGFDKEDIDIKVNDGCLTVKARKSSEKNEEDKNYIRRERTYGEYQRSFTLGNVDPDNIEAKFENGMLMITVPKKEEIDTSKTIQIK